MNQIDRAAAAAAATADAMDQKIDEASSSAHDAIDRISSTAKPAIDRAAAGAHRAVDKAAVAASDASESLEATVERLLDNGAGVTESCRTYVRENPLLSLGLAFAAGVLLSRTRIR